MLSEARGSVLRRRLGGAAARRLRSACGFFEGAGAPALQAFQRARLLEHTEAFIPAMRAVERRAGHQTAPRSSRRPDRPDGKARPARSLNARQWGFVPRLRKEPRRSVSAGLVPRTVRLGGIDTRACQISEEVTSGDGRAPGRPGSIRGIPQARASAAATAPALNATLSGGKSAG